MSKRSREDFETIKKLRNNEFQGKANVSRKKINHQEIQFQVLKKLS